MKNILLLIHDDKGQEARYQAALDLCRLVNGHLTCVDVTIIPEFVDDYVGASGILLAREQITEPGNKARMAARLEREDVSFDWIDRIGFVTQTIEDHSGLADVIVLSGDADETLFPHMADVTGDLLVRLGKPILVVPTSVRAIDFYGKALVAWDGSEDAEAALKAALPMLEHARTVTLFHVDDGSLRLPLEDAARYLSRHGIELVIKQQPVDFERPGTVILAEAEAGKFDYVVMGAYSRSRGVEAIFGGATRTMLKKSSVPVLLAHRR